MRAGEAQVLAQELHQQSTLFDVAGNGFTVHGHGHGRHDLPPKNSGLKALFSPSPLRATAPKARIRADFGPNTLWNMNKSEPPSPTGSRESNGEDAGDCRS